MKRKIVITLFALVVSVGTLFAEKVKIGALYYYLNEADKTAQVTSENSNSPYWTTNITTATIPDSVIFQDESYSVVSIGQRAFDGCSNLSSIIIPDNIKEVEQYAFIGCSSAKKISVGNGVSIIYSGTFSGCTNVDTIEIGTGISIIYDSGGFDGCKHVKKVTWNAKNCMDLNDSQFGRKTPFIKSISDDPQLEAVEIVIGDSVEYIPATLFTDVPIKKITLGKNVKDFGEYPFRCSQYTLSRSKYYTLENIELVWNAKKLEKQNILKFKYTKDVISYGSEESVTYDIGSHVTSITVGDSVENFPQSFFAQLPNLRKMKWKAINCADFSENTCPNNAQMDSVCIGDSVEHIPSYLFYNTPKLKNITIPSSLKSVGQNAFQDCPNLDSVNCKSLSTWASVNFENAKSTPLYGNGKLLINGQFIGKNLEIPDGVMDIGTYAFYNCKSIENIILPNSINSIGQNAFNTCPYLLTIHARMEYPPTVESNVFANCGSLYGINLYVPKNSLAQYRKANVWSSFNIQEEIQKYTITFINWDDSELLKLEVKENTIPEYIGETPQRFGNAQYTYTFAGWSPTIVAATADATYKATYNRTTNQYTITFLNDDNGVLSSKLWDYGTTPTCEQPTKEEDDEYTYSFSGWSPKIVPVVADATYTATYSAEKKAEGIEDVLRNTIEKPCKALENGNIYILMPNGTKYTIIGNQIK